MKNSLLEFWNDWLGTGVRMFIQQRLLSTCYTPALCKALGFQWWAKQSFLLESQTVYEIMHCNHNIMKNTWWAYTSYKRDGSTQNKQADCNIYICSRCRQIFSVKGSVQFSSVAQLCPTLCHPIVCSTPGFPVHHQLPELTQTHVHLVGDTIQPSHLLWSLSLAFNYSQRQGLF